MIEKVVKSKAIPRTIFMEKQDIIVSMLLAGEQIRDQSDLDKIYCSDSQMQTNNFWRQRSQKKG